MRNAVILVLEDNRAVADALACVLREGGGDVMIANDRAQAHTAVADRGGCVDIILADYELAHGADGVSVATSLLLAAPHAHVLILSGAADRAAAPAAEAGFTVLAKPAKARAILDWIEENLPR